MPDLPPPAIQGITKMRNFLLAVLLVLSPILAQGTPVFPPAELLVLNAKTQGVKGDGTTDDRVAINAAFLRAVSDNKALYLAAGTYIINGQALQMPSGLRLIGDGIGRTIIKVKDAATGDPIAMVNLDTTNGNDNISVSDLTIDCNTANRPGSVAHGLRFLAADGNHCDNIHVRNVRVINVPFAAMQLMNCKRYSVTGCEVDGTGRDGITVWYGSEYGEISGNKVFNAGDDCIALNSQAGTHTGTTVKFCTITGNVLMQKPDSVYGTGIRVGGAEDVTVTGNVLEFAQGWGYIVEGGYLTPTTMHSKRVTVQGNTIKAAGNASSGGGGIAVTADTDEVTVANNCVIGYYSNGIQVAGSASVVGNQVGQGILTTGVGIYALGQYSTIVGNTVKNTQSSGIQLGAEKIICNSNVVYNAGVGNAGASFILLVGGLNRCVVNGNIVRRNTAGAYGIRIATGTGTGNVITGNVAQTFPVGQDFSDGSSGTNTFANNVMQ